MKKKLIGLLLAVALVIGLVPVMAMAEGADLASKYTLKFGYNSYNLTKYDTPVYFVNGAATELPDTAGNTFTYYVPTPAGATEDNWTAKLIWHTGDQGPTLYLDGFVYDLFNETSEKWRANKDTQPTTAAQDTAIIPDASYPLTIVLQGEDSVLKTKFGISFSNDVTIKSEGDAKLTAYMASSFMRSTTAGADVNIDANLDAHVVSVYTGGWGVIRTTEADIKITGGKVNLTSGHASVYCFLPYTSGNVYISGGADVYVKGGYYGLYTANADCNLYVNNASLAIYGSYGGVRANEYKTPVVVEGTCAVLKEGGKADGSTAVEVETFSKQQTYYSVTNHTPTEVPAVSATCKADGNIQYWSCEKCGKYYADADAATEISDKNSVKVLASTVDCKPEADDGDCTTAIKCSVCGKETTAAKAAHTAGTWTDGKTNCTVCNKEITCTPTGGTATCQKKAVCTVCGEEYGELGGHTPAADDGDCSTAVKCTVCGKDALAAGEHFGGTATCKAKAKCASCGKEYGELAAHKPEADDDDCTTAIKCSVCGTETTAAKTHTEEVIPGKAATTTETGLTEGKKCSVCGKILVAQQEIAKLPAAGGSNGNPTTGDNSHIAVWMGLMVVSAAAFVCILVISKKKSA